MGLFNRKKGGTDSNSKLNISTSNNGDEYIIVVGGRLDTLTSPELDGEINKVIGKAKKLIFDLGELDDLTATIAGVIPLQLFAYNVALAKGTDVDQPRNLAKSVTVE